MDKTELPDCNRILPRLYQGAAPPADATLMLYGFNVLVLCAIEYQPKRELFGGVTVLRCPFGDNYDVRLTSVERRLIFDTSARVIRALRAGARTYVSCAMGLNRSGLVNALVVRDMTGSSGREARQWVQSRRPGALQNPHFGLLLDGLARTHADRRELRIDRG